MIFLVLVFFKFREVIAIEDVILKRLDKMENMQKVLISTVRYQRGQIQHLQDQIEILQQVQILRFRHLLNSNSFRLCEG